MDKMMLFYRFFSLQIRRGKAWRWFLLVGLLPSFIILTNLTFSQPSGWGTGGRAFLFMGITLSFFFTFYILVVSLFFSASVLAEEIEQQTIVFLYTLPMHRSRIILAKFFATLMLTLILVLGSMIPALLLSNHHQLSDFSTIQSMLKICAAALLGTAAYSAFSFFLGTLLKRPILIGLFFVFPWEQFVQYMPGFIQKLSIIYYIKSFLPTALPEKASMLRIFQSTVSPFTAIAVLLSITLLFSWAAAHRSSTREFIMGDR